MTANYTNWETEFVDAKFVDQRLKTRFFKIMDAFGAAPDKSTWAAAGSRSSAKAAYRFFVIQMSQGMNCWIVYPGQL